MRKYLSLLLLFALHAQAAPTVSLTATPATGTSPLSVTLVWSSTEAVSCTASGGWTGSKPVSGTATVSVTASTAFTLTCSGSTTETTQLTWTAPTTNTDGSPLTDLAGFKIYTAGTSADVESATPILVGPAVTSYTFTGLPAGLNFFAMKAFNSYGVESVFTGTVSKNVRLASASATANVAVVVAPRPPTLLTITTVAYEVVLHPIEGTRLGRAVGTVPIGTPCGDEVVAYSWGGAYYAIPRESVVLSKASKSAVLVAQCSA